MAAKKGGPEGRTLKRQKWRIVMNSTRNSGSLVTQVSTTIAGLVLVGYGVVFIVGAVIGF